jgi:chromosomal replication initiation ATPase DnaA
LNQLLPLLKKVDSLQRQIAKLINEEPKLVQAQRSFIVKNEEIAKVIGDVYECDPFKRTREYPYMFARHYLCYALYQHTRMSQLQIAKYVGLADHSSVHNSIKQSRRLLDVDEYFINKAMLINEKLRELSI